MTDNQSVISFLIAEINASQAQGRVSYDAEASGTCIDSLKAMTCDEFKQGIGGNMAACMAFIMPKVAQGGACTQDFECTTGNCEGADVSVDPPVDGTCAAAPTLAAIGTSCATTSCVDGAYCDSTTSTCVARKAAGETCTSDNECVNTCDTTTDTCTCYSGCHVAAPTTPATTVLSLCCWARVSWSAARDGDAAKAPPLRGSAAAAAPCARAGYGANHLQIESG